MLSVSFHFLLRPLL